MSSLFYRLINPTVKWVLRSPLHSLMSQNTLLVEFTGRKSGRALSTPISYYISDGHAHCLTSKSYHWWQNLLEGRRAHITINGERFETTPIVEADDQAKIVAAQRAFFKAVPRDAKFAGVKLGQDGEPNEEDIQRLASELVHLSFPLPAN